MILRSGNLARGNDMVADKESAFSKINIYRISGLYLRSKINRSTIQNKHYIIVLVHGSVPDPHGFGSVIYLYGSGSGTFHQQAKK
jgi:hypothetical protein